MADWIEPGEKAPAFTLQDDQGKKVKLSELKGSPVVLYFYPRDVYKRQLSTSSASSFRQSMGKH